MNCEVNGGQMETSRGETATNKRRSSQQEPKGRKSSALSIQRVDIVFDNADSLYFAGQKMMGKIVIDLTHSVRVNEILVEIRGGAKTYWTKYGGRSRKHYRAAEPYFCEQFNTNYTKQYSNGKELPVLPQGKHEIPFFHRLAENLPSSFEGDFGYVRYTCKVTLERPWETDVICQRAFNVAGEEVLAEEKSGLAQISKSETRTEYTCCFRKGVVKVQMQLPKSYYVPGEVLEVSSNALNCSGKTLRSCQVRLFQVIKYNAKDFSGKEHSRTVRKQVLATDSFQIAPAQQIDKLHCIALPPLPPKLTRCKIIEVNYACEFCTNGNATYACIPITLGTITPKKLMRERRAEARSLERLDESATLPAQLLETGSWAEKISIRTMPLGEITLFDHDKATDFGNQLYTPKYPCLVVANK